MGVNREFWKGKRVFLTGHTGFKGGWLSLWLADMGAEVHGYALPAPTEPSFFLTSNVEERLASSTIADVRDVPALSEALRAAQPDVVFHLAAQSLVRLSYSAPVETYAVNVMGTVNLLEAVRETAGIAAVLNVTSDKCYENREWVWPYRESEAMGGFDPYSSSKGCAELVTAAYRRSFLEEAGVQLASARAGNVIGGGDWAADRLVPDFLRALDAGQVLTVRSPGATRPWQHVLEPLSGYLILAEKLCTEGSSHTGAWNLGPEYGDCKTVKWIVEYLCSQQAGAQWQCHTNQEAHEANALQVDSSKARSVLGWRPRWNLQAALDKTLDWHEAWKQGSATDMAEFGLKQIQEYEAVAEQA